MFDRVSLALIAFVGFWLGLFVVRALEEKNRYIRWLEDRLLAVLPDSDAPTAETDVDRVIDQLGKRMVPAPDRQRLRGAIDKADARGTGA